MSFDDQGTLEVREDDKNSDYEVLSFLAAVVRNFMDMQGEYRNTMYEILTFIVDVTKEMPYFSYPFFYRLPHQEFTVVFGAALMQTWNDYTESEQSEI